MKGLKQFYFIFGLICKLVGPCSSTWLLALEHIIKRLRDMVKVWEIIMILSKIKKSIDIPRLTNGGRVIGGWGPLGFGAWNIHKAWYALWWNNDYLYIHTKTFLLLNDHPLLNLLIHFNTACLSWAANQIHSPG